MLDRLAGHEYYCFLDGYSGYNHIAIAPKDQEKTTFTSPYGTFAFRRMPFELCNAPNTFQRCMMAIFSDMVEKTIEAFMDEFSVLANSFCWYVVDSTPLCSNIQFCCIPSWYVVAENPSSLRSPLPTFGYAGDELKSHLFLVHFSA